MKQALNKQSGLTFIGLVFVLGVIAMVVLFVLRLFPLYNEKMQVEGVMQTVISQPDAASQSVSDLRRSFLRAITITNVTRFNDRNIKDHLDLVKPQQSGQPPSLHVHFQSTNKLFGDIQLLMTFDKQVPITGTAGAGGN